MFKLTKGQKEHEAEEMQREEGEGGEGPLCGAQPTKVDFNNASVRASLSSPGTHISMRRDGTGRDVALH